MASMADQMRAMFRKDPSLSPKEVARRVGSKSNGTAYGIKRQMTVSGELSALVNGEVPSTEDNPEVVMLRRQNAALRKRNTALMAMLADEL